MWIKNSYNKTPYDLTTECILKTENKKFRQIKYVTCYYKSREKHHKSVLPPKQINTNKSSVCLLLISEITEDNINDVSVS